MKRIRIGHVLCATVIGGVGFGVVRATFEVGAMIPGIISSVITIAGVVGSFTILPVMEEGREEVKT